MLEQGSVRVSLPRTCALNWKSEVRSLNSTNACAHKLYFDAAGTHQVLGVLAEIYVSGPPVRSHAEIAKAYHRVMDVS